MVKLRNDLEIILLLSVFLIKKCSLTQEMVRACRWSIDVLLTDTSVKYMTGRL